MDSDRAGGFHWRGKLSVSYLRQPFHDVAGHHSDLPVSSRLSLVGRTVHGPTADSRNLGVDRGRDWSFFRCDATASVVEDPSDAAHHAPSHQATEP